MRRHLLPLATLALAALAALPAGAAAEPFLPRVCTASVRPQEVIVDYERGTSAARAARVERRTGTEAAERLASGRRVLEIEDGGSVAETVRELRSDPAVASAVPNAVARASAFFPDDPGPDGRGWAATQWNLAGENGVRAPEAWELSMAAGASGGRGATVAVIDTGVAYQTRGRFRRAPDLYPNRFLRGHDFVDEDPFANDENGHGTHVTGTIAQRTNNGRGLAGLAYGVKVMPLRVLDECGFGDTVAISRAIRFAARRGIDVINLSLEFDSGQVRRASQIPEILSAVRYARRSGAVITAASGNDDSGFGPVAYPARLSNVIAVGATTPSGCLAYYSNDGPGLDLVAPGGGRDAAFDDNPDDAARCRPFRAGAFIFQQTFTRSVRSFGFPADFEGTSMATPHVSAAAALLIASRRIGRSPSPRAVEARLEATARDLGPAGPDPRYGAGLLDAAAALAP